MSNSKPNERNTQEPNGSKPINTTFGSDRKTIKTIPQTGKK